MNDERYQEMLADAEAYNKSLLGKSYRYDLTKKEQAEYESLLNISGNGIMGYIEIPTINCGNYCLLYSAQCVIIS